MKKTSQLIIIISFVLFPSFKSLLAQSTINAFSKSERIVKKLIRKKQVPGLAITVSKNNKVLWSKGYGYSDLTNKTLVDPDKTVFRIGSVSKPIAAIGLLKIVEDSLMTLESSIYNYVPYFPKKDYDITIKQLGGHLSGIRNYQGNEFKLNKPLDIREGISLFANDSLLFQPGTKYNYTSYNWNLISLAIQECTKIPFEDFVKYKVLIPFNMNKTFVDNNQYIDGKAIFYKKIRKRHFKPVENVNNYFKIASGGYLSTSKDINIFGNALLNDSLVNPKQFKPFITAQKINNNDANSTYYGIGFQVSKDSSGRPYFGHIGNGLGGYGIFYVYPEQKVVLSILTNTSNPNVDKKFNKLIDTLFDSINNL
ncbi:serine hydrolase domain-containing protein [Siansivirga zeaxanthinifaciens]|uniref:Beta-lactamase n=1 Tax=Siansivirga zeaxanthinifaciens CC-SAMT-1 TaxID=1454006 RepID=A0A0C5VZX3_9FLAO|nr:serine hydrolase domain-containing protein [Siansivirga zeaxanthinifaciens]AJR04586.1 beta-lactamase [Siansivirga zeaxanthinifaciens CC-SAMT-1]